MEAVKKIVRTVLKRFGRELVPSDYLDTLRSRREVYSQYGEDLIITCYAHNKGFLHAGSYVDIGANHPHSLSNTALLHQMGWTGINIEPDPKMFKLLQKFRSRDINLNLGISNRVGNLGYFEFKNCVYNTFSEDEAVLLSQKGEILLGRRDVEVSTFNQIVKTHLQGKPPTLLSLDAEGLDEAILESIDYPMYGPRLICVETYSYGSGVKNTRIGEILAEQGYLPVGETFVNTIFAR